MLAPNLEGPSVDPVRNAHLHFVLAFSLKGPCVDRGRNTHLLCVCELDVMHDLSAVHL